MLQIKGMELIEREFGKSSLLNFRVIQEIELCVDGAQEGYKLKLVLVSDEGANQYELVLQFSGVVNFHLNGKEHGVIRLIGFDIMSISDRQWEGLNWEFVDYEHNSLGFYAKTAEVVSLRAVRD